MMTGPSSISEERMSEANPKVGIREVALEAGVSIATVSRALRGLRNVHPETRDRIFEAVRRTNYLGGTTPETRFSGSTNTVGVVVPYVLRWYFAQVIGGVTRALREAGIDLLLYNFSQSKGRELLFQHQHLKGRVDSLIVISLPPTEEEFRSLLSLDVPISLVGFHHEGCSSVAIDDVLGARIATQHLIDLGHRKIGLISGRPTDPLGFTVPRDRRSGFLQVLQENGLAWSPGLEVFGDFSMMGGSQAMQELLELRDRPTAIFALSDEMALGALQTIRRNGLRVPEDISIIGFDDHEMAEFSELTTIRQPVQELGESAALAIIERLHSPQPRLESVTLPTELVVRNSTASISSEVSER